MGIIYPIFFIAMMCALGFIFRAWKPTVGFVIRLRYLFAIVVPGTVFGLITTLAMVNLSGSLYQKVSFAQTLLLVIIYAVTAYRGPFSKMDRGERIGMSVVISVLIMIFILTAQILSMVIAIIPTSIEVFETIKPQIEAIKAAQETATD